MPSTAREQGWAMHMPANRSLAELDLTEDASLPGRFLAQWRREPWRQLCGPDGGWITSDELEARTRRVAERLRASGLVPGDRLVLSAGSCTELVIAYVAALRAGLVVVPLNTAYTEAEVQRIVRAAQPAAAVVDDDQRAVWIRSAAPDRPVYGISLELPPGDGDDAIDAACSDAPALLVYTSGTTGQPKGALLTHGNLLASATAVGLAWRWEFDDRLLLTLPLFHLHGLGVGLNGALCAGASIDLRERFDVDDVVERSAQGATMFFGVPAMYERLASSGKAGALARLRLLVSGSAPLPAALATEIARSTGQIPLERYGMTETVMLTSNPYRGPRRPGTVGVALPGVEVRLGDGGEVEVAGPNVISGYHDNAAATAEAFTADGWFRTGDLGEFDTDGYLTLVGRSKELIITGGYNVHPREVEEAIATHPDVREVAVVGRASDRWGEEVTAVVVVHQLIDPETLRAHAALTLAPYKVPKRVEFTDVLPRNALGKLVRREL